MDIKSSNIDVGVMINDLITSGEKGVEYSSKSSTIHCKNDGVIFTPFRSNNHSKAIHFWGVTAL